MIRLLICLILVGGMVCPAVAQRSARESSKSTAAPDFANVPYGTHKRQVLDLWQADGTGPRPLVVYIHGGGFHAGDKSSLSSGLRQGLLAAGISVMAVNYRFSPEVTMPAHYLDCARAIQLARARAAEWNIDPNRIAATGGSAGAGTSLWIGFHDDLADPDSTDPVARQSTRLTCMAVYGAQSTYDPHLIEAWIGPAAARHPAFPGFYGFPLSEKETPQAKEKFRLASPLTWLNAGDPPVYAIYNEPRGPLPDNAVPGQGIHHIQFGIELKKQMDPLGIECIVRHSDEQKNTAQEVMEFLSRHLLAK